MEDSSEWGDAAEVEGPAAISVPSCWWADVAAAESSGSAAARLLSVGVKVVLPRNRLEWRGRLADWSPSKMRAEGRGSSLADDCPSFMWNPIGSGVTRVSCGNGGTGGGAAGLGDPAAIPVLIN